MDDAEQKKAMEISSAHIIAFRKNVMNCSQEELADKIGVSTITIGRYERKEIPVSQKSAAKLAELSGFIPEYWLGTTENTTESAYIAECESEGLSAYCEEIDRQKRRDEQRKLLLSMCGYGYENLNSSEPRYDFLSLSNAPEDIKDFQMVQSGYPHKITNYQSSQEAVYFSSAELDTLFESVKDLIGYSCYKKATVK